MLNLRQLKRKKITCFQCTNNCVHKLQQKQIGSYSRFLKGHNSMNCLLLTSTSRCTLEFHLVCFLFIFPFLVACTYLKRDPPVDSEELHRLHSIFGNDTLAALNSRGTYCGELRINPLASCCLLKCFAAVTR